MSAYSDKVIADGAVAYWRLDEASGNVVSEVGGYSGTVSGGVTRSQLGALADGNTAMVFDGTSGMIVTPAVTISVTVSVEAWIRTTAAGGYRAILGNRDGGGGHFFGMDPANKAVFYYFGGVSSTKVINDGVLHHVVMTSDGTNTRIYIDGIVDNTSPLARTAETFPICIGEDLGSYWLGLIDEVAIYHTVLTPQQIAEHYFLSSPTKYMEVLPAGIVITMPRFRVYALPAKQVHVESDVPVEFSGDVDGPWVPASANKLAKGGFVRCATADTAIVCKTRK